MSDCSYTEVPIWSPYNREHDNIGVNLDMLPGHDLAVTVIYPHPRHPLLTQFSDAHSRGKRNAMPSYDKFDKLIDKIDVEEEVKAKFFHNLLAWCQRDGEKLLVFSQYLMLLKFLQWPTVQINGLVYRQ